MLNGIWLSFFLAAFAAALWQWLGAGNPEVFARLVEALFDMARLSVDIVLVLAGTMTLWLGFLAIAEKAGMIRLMARLLDPLFRRLMPEVPSGHPAMGLISMNFAANILGLDNAATPIGIKAMHSLQELNPSSERASNAQILFLVLNTSSLTLLPVTIFMYRAQQGAAEPTSVFLPILLATTASSLAGLLSVALMQRIRLWQPVVLAYLVGAGLALGLLLAVLAGAVWILMGQMSDRGTGETESTSETTTESVTEEWTGPTGTTDDEPADTGTPEAPTTNETISPEVPEIPQLPDLGDIPGLGGGDNPNAGPGNNSGNGGGNSGNGGDSDVNGAPALPGIPLPPGLTG